MIMTSEQLFSASKAIKARSLLEILLYRLTALSGPYQFCLPKKLVLLNLCRGLLRQVLSGFSLK
jgi:hypothetical protein